MRYLEMFESYTAKERKVKDEIYSKWITNVSIHTECTKYGITNYTINSDGSIDVDGNVDLSCVGFERLPLKFNIVTGNFFCSNNYLTSLEGAPKKIGRGFYCSNNFLTSLEGGPQEVGDDFVINRNKLTNLKGCPSVCTNLYCENNMLTSLEGGPKKVGGYRFGGNLLPKLIYDNFVYMKEILKWQDEYNIWRNDGTLDEFRFGEMMIDIKNEVDK